MPNGTELYLCPKWLWKISVHPCTRGLGSPRMVPLQASMSVSPYITTSKACADKRTLSWMLCMPTRNADSYINSRVQTQAHLVILIYQQAGMLHARGDICSPVNAGIAQRQSTWASAMST